MFILVNIGCLGCGVSSNIVGVFTERATAEKVAVTLNKHFHWREGGQNEFEIFPMPEAVNRIHPEYIIAFSEMPDA
jgi:hypothetical protein